MARSIHEIMTAAFDEVKRDHGIALDHVQYTTISSGTMGEIDHECSGIDVYGKTVTVRTEDERGAAEVTRAFIRDMALGGPLSKEMEIRCGLKRR